MHRSAPVVASLVVVLPLAFAGAACGGGRPASLPSRAAPPTPAPGAAPGRLAISAAIRAAVDAADRDAEDRALDAGRRPAELLAFAGVKPGMKVADLAAGGGYTTELLVRVVGPTGVVYGQNAPELLARLFDQPWTARLSKPVNRGVIKVTRDLDDPLPPDAKDLDVVVCNLFYHDLFWLGADRARMNAAIGSALRPGGLYVVTDHSGRPGTGATEVKTLHRIEERVVREEIERAGFKLVSEGAFLRSAGDARDWSTAPSAAGDRRGTSDRFVLAFVRP